MKLYKSARALARFCSRQPLMRDWIGQFALYYTDIGTNFSYDIETNGEAWLISACASLRPRMVVDIGANIGEWTLRAVQSFPEARLFAFEPNPQIYEELGRKTANIASITCVPQAISAEAGNRALHIKSGPHSGVSSLTKFEHHDERVLVSAIRGDDWMKSRGVEHIDLMKVDVEGHEYSVLRSFELAFRESRIGVVQFEFAIPNPVERVFLRDICHFAKSHGYLVGRLYPKFVLFKEYDIRDEWWHGPNYVMCNSADERYLEALESKNNRDFFMQYVSLS
jgi:FkbM family methyltransferase